MSQKSVPVIKDRDIAIVGMSCLFPKARNLNEFWTNIVSKKDCISDIPETHWDPKDYFSEDLKDPDKTYCKRGGFLPFVEFDPMKYGIGPKDLDVIDTAQLLGMKVAREALKDAGYLSDEGGREFDRDRCAAIVGTTSITELTTPLNKRLSYPVIDKVLQQHGVPRAMRDSITQQYRDSYPIWQENSFPGVLGNVVSGRIASHLNLGGTNCVIDAACASALGAVKMAADALLTGTCDMAITGGVDTENNIFMYMCFSKTPAFSKEGKSRPFDASSDGILIAEGIGLMVLKRYQDALRDGDKIYAVMRSIGSSSDGRGKSIYQPVSEGQAKAVRQAYELGGVTPRDIELLEAHGTGTPVGDMKEFSGLKFVYGEQSEHDKWCAIGSVKSQIGHSKASAGIAGVMKAALSIYHHILPPTINVKTPNPEMNITESPFYINSELRPWTHNSEDHLRRAGTSAFGFGGTNFHVLLEQHDDENFTSLLNTGVDFLPIADNDVDGLLNQIVDLRDQLDIVSSVRDLCAYFRYKFNHQLPYKTSLVVTDLSDLEAKLSELSVHLENHPDRTLSTRSGIFFLPGEEFQDAKVAVLFPGQGSQYPGMLRELITHRSEAQEFLQRVNLWRNSKSLRSLNDVIYPISAFDEQTLQDQRDYLTRTDNTQASLSFANLAAFQVLKKMGLQVDAVAGHSYGELSALFAAEVIDFESYMKLTHRRGELMRECNEKQGGAMLAVLAPKNDVVKALDSLDKSKYLIEVANYNTPDQIVLSGDVAAIQKAESLLKSSNLRAIRLAVGAAFHSSLMEEASASFAKDLKNVQFDEGVIPVYSNTIADIFPKTRKDKSSLLARQLRESVQFEKMIRKMVDDGCRIFVEAGPSGVLGRLVGQILENEPHVVLSMDAGEIKSTEQEIDLRKRFLPLTTCLAHLTAMGKVQLESDSLGETLTEFPKKRRQSPVTVKLNGANFLRPEMRAVPDKAGKVQFNTIIAEKVEMSRVEAENELDARLKNVESQHSAEISKLTTELNTIHQEKIELEKKLKNVQSDLQKTKVQVPSQPLSGDMRGVTERRPEEKAVRGKSSTPVYRGPVRRSQGKIMSKKTIKQAKGIIEEYNDYRFKMLEVHEQFLQMQSDANRLFERMVFDDNPSVISSEPEIEYSPIEYSENVQEAFERPTIPSQSVAFNKIDKTQHSVPPMADRVTLKSEENSASGWKSPEQKVESHSEKNGSLLSAMFETDQEQPTVSSSPFTLPKLNSENKKSSPSTDISEKGVSSNATEIQSYLIATIAEKTGFPQEMIESGMDLEEDLAVDSIRRVEILGAVQEKFPNAPTIGPSQLGVLKSVGDIADFLAADSEGPSTMVSNAATQSIGIGASQVDSTSGNSNSGIADFLMQTIADKTGFPMEMITSDMKLEEDLAVDSIRRVEILGAVQEKFPEAPTVGPEQLGVLQSIEDIVGYLDKDAEANQPTVPTAIAIDASNVGMASDILKGLLDVISDKTGFPLEMLTPDMDLESDLAVDSIRRVEILGAIQERFPQAPTVGPSEMGVLKTIEDLARHLGGAIDDVITLGEKKKRQLV